MEKEKKLLILAHSELSQTGAPTTLEDNHRSLKISRDAFGQWFFTDHYGFSRLPNRNYLDLSSLPSLAKLLTNLEESDDHLRINGGRVFISDSCVYRKTSDSVKQVLF